MSYRCQLALTLAISFLLRAVQCTQAFIPTTTFPSPSIRSNADPRVCLKQSVKSEDQTASDHSKSRRDAIFLTLSTLSIFGINSQAVNAFPNKIGDKYDDRPKRKGPQPNDLGVSTRKDIVGEEYLGLKNCGSAPNCFCSTDSIEDDPEHNIPSWVWPEKYANDQEKAFTELEEVINSYEPGQGMIDGGGFKVIKSDPKAGYLYAQFQSYKNGYIDDFELAYLGGDRVVNIRSSSRVGYLDFGVNAKRVNYIANILKAKGWNAPGVDFASHQDYAIQIKSSKM
eukprot:CAMPEP_0198294108 /NCGR_PEP_ID=MMETSP1449-20131203/20704_1 /TAXON_ID=420275 /ORGANISM="Attheya septentrionalis, Strain CCMP2084" /LENGTH=282 /DNA_ID=CAMNT_0043993965 /DNA_START=117 /DNA_END=963 /DNA_ORIENTATION=-